MSTVLSIDPGIRGVGAALWRDRVLVAAAYVRSAEVVGNGPRECVAVARAALEWASKWAGLVVEKRIDQLVVEWPQTYDGRSSRGDTNDLLPLAGVDAALVTLLPFSKVAYFVPHEWKGGTQKPSKASDPYVIEERVKDRLDAGENQRVEWPRSEKHGWDVADAIGIGLKFLGRFERKRVFARE